MSQQKIPSALLPVGAAVVAMAVAWGSSQSAIANVTKETKRVEAIVLEVSKEQAKTGKDVALNAAAIKVLADSVMRQEKTASASDEKLAKLIEIMISKQ